MAPDLTVPPPQGSRQPCTREWPSRRSLRNFGGFEEIVAVVGVAHDEVLAAGCGDAAHEGVAVAAAGDVDDASAEFASDLLGAVGAAVVADDDFAGDVVFAEDAHGFFDAGADGVRLVEAGHDDGELEGDSCTRKCSTVPRCEYQESNLQSFQSSPQAFLNGRIMQRNIIANWRDNYSHPAPFREHVRKPLERVDGLA